ncbi:hypothetical protein ACFE04_000467 [Oxalis oulophora]
MEYCKTLTGRVSVTILLVLLAVAAAGHAKAENKTDPLQNVNLAPYWQWRSAYECMQLQYNWTANTCSEKDIISIKGIVDVPQEEITNYCQPDGCKAYIMKTLQCIRGVKRNFWFANNATVQVLNETIIHGCGNGIAFSTLNYTRLRK